MLGDRLEGHQKAAEIGVVVENAGLIEIQGRSVVAGAELDQGFRSDCAFEMEMQLGFG